MWRRGAGCIVRVLPAIIVFVEMQPIGRVRVLVLEYRYCSLTDTVSTLTAVQKGAGGLSQRWKEGRKEGRLVGWH